MHEIPYAENLFFVSSLDWLHTRTKSSRLCLSAPKRVTKKQPVALSLEHKNRKKLRIFDFRVLQRNWDFPIVCHGSKLTRQRRRPNKPMMVRFNGFYI